MSCREFDFYLTFEKMKIFFNPSLFIGIEKTAIERPKPVMYYFFHVKNN